jgi:hypothetical protein
MTKFEKQQKQQAINAKISEIKIQAMQEFLTFAMKQNFYRRLVFAMRILFKAI